MSIEKIKLAAEQITNRMPAVKGKGEETTKQAMVMPMLQAMERNWAECPATCKCTGSR